jgi:hypothetical protein
MKSLEDIEALPPRQLLEHVLRLYKDGLELAHYRSLWYRIWAIAGNAGARIDQEGYQQVTRLVVRYANSSPECQAIWRELCTQEPADSPAKPFLASILRSTCGPPLQKVQDQRIRNEAWALHNQMQRQLEELEEMRERLERDRDRRQK